MSKRLSYLIIFILSFLLGVILTFQAEKKYRKYPVPKTEIQIDTVRDTILIDSPIPYERIILDTIRVPVFLAGKNDTVYVSLPREQKAYRDSTYEAWVSGIQPDLDSIRIFSNTVYTTVANTVEIPAKPKKDFVELDGRLMYDRSFTAPVTLNIGHRYGPFEVYAGGGYDFMQKSVVGQVGGRLVIGF